MIDMNKVLRIILSCFVFLNVNNLMANDNYKLKFQDFNELNVVDGINVDYICDESKAGTVEFSASKDIVSSIIFEPNKTKLSIKLASRDTVYTDLPTITVYSSYLTSVKNDGDSLVRVLSVADGPKFSCRVIGNGRIAVRNVKANEVNVTILTGKGIISIYGECKLADLRVAGAGHIQADELKALDVSCSASHGTINCYAVENLSAGGVSGKVFYRGNPQIKKRFISHVKLTSLDEQNSTGN